MVDRNLKRIGAPFYAPSRRKTSAEIISEARAAIDEEMGSMSNETRQGALRLLRTRRPFTPREPQRVLFAERARKRDMRPPSSFDFKYLSLSEDVEEREIKNVKEKTFDEPVLSDLDTVFKDAQKPRAKPKVRPNPPDTGSEGWGGFMKLPHLSGRSKPLHKRSTTISGHGHDEVSNDLSKAIFVTQPINADSMVSNVKINHEKQIKSLSPNQNDKRKQFANGKSISYDASVTFGQVAVRSLDVQMPCTANVEVYDRMSILELAEMLNRRSRNVDRSLNILEALQKTLDKSVPANSLRDLVLQSLYVHIDSDDERILVAIARAMLTMRVTGTHLAAACKLVFKIARNDKNDNFFLNSNLLELLVEGCGRLDPVAESECCVYAAGALRFLTLEPRLCELAHQVGALHIAVLHLKILNNATSNGKCTEGVAHALYQVAGALRGLAGVTPSAFANSGALHELIEALAAHTQRDVITNVARCLSVLSADASCCAELCSRAGATRALLNALSACAARAPLAVRLTYTLGNMAANDCRAALYIYNEEGAVDVLLAILESYTQRVKNNIEDPENDPDLHLVDSDLGGSDGSSEDVLVKTIRVLANLCLAEQAGRGIASAHASRTIDAMVACLHLVETSSKIKDVSEESKRIRDERNSELALASLAALNNVSFYLQPAPSHPLHDSLDELCIVSCKWLSSELAGVAAEAARVLGNVSRSQRAAQLLVVHDGLPTLAILLQHDDPSVRCAAAGVLVNVCGCGARDASAAAAATAAAALDDAARSGDATTAALLTRALWNTMAQQPLNYSDVKRTTSALTYFLDDESVFVACETAGHGVRNDSHKPIMNNTNLELENNTKRHENTLNKFKQTSNPRYQNDGALDEDGDCTGYSGEDLGFEEGDIEDCDCAPCKRLAAWDELMGVAIPLLEKLRPPRVDVAIGTD